MTAVISFIFNPYVILGHGTFSKDRLTKTNLLDHSDSLRICQKSQWKSLAHYFLEGGGGGGGLVVIPLSVVLPGLPTGRDGRTGLGRLGLVGLTTFAI